jgi:Protein of unknown function (DUF3619)
MNMLGRPNEDNIVETRLGARLASALSMQLDSAPHDISERLRFAREQALVRARAVRAATPSGTVVSGVTDQGSLLLNDFVPWWQRAASFVPLVLLVLGLVAIDQWSAHEQVLAVADFDAQLLADDLPPAAYSDPGFAEFLRSAPSQ